MGNRWRMIDKCRTSRYEAAIKQSDLEFNDDLSMNKFHFIKFFVWLVVSMTNLEDFKNMLN